MQGENEKIILEKLNSIEKRLDGLQNPRPSKTAFPDFCKEKNISRPTGYAWADKGLIRLEKIGGRQYVLLDSVAVTNKYERKPRQ